MSHYSFRSAKASVKTGDEKVIELLTREENKHVIDTQDRNGDTLLHMAIQQLSDAVEANAKKGAPKSAKREPKSAKGVPKSETLKACQNHLNIAVFLAKHSDKFVRNRNNRFPGQFLLDLMYDYLNENAMVPLLENVITKEECDCQAAYLQRTLLHHLVLAHRWMAVKIAVKKGADVTIEDEEGRTALTLAAQQPGVTLDVIEGLIHPAILNLQTKGGDTALHCVAEKSNPFLTSNTPVTRCLLQAGANTDLKNHVNYLPLDEYLFMNVLGILDPVLFESLLPKDGSLLALTLIQMVLVMFSIGSLVIDRRSIKSVIEIMMLHIKFPRWKEVSYERVSKFSRNYHIRIKDQYLHNNTCSGLKELSVATYVLTHSGCNIEKAPKMLEPEENDSDDEQEKIERINLMLEQYANSQGQPSTLFSQCGNVIRTCIQRPLSVGKLDQLKIPSSVTERIAKKDVAENLCQVIFDFYRRE